MNIRFSPVNHGVIQYIYESNFYSARAVCRAHNAQHITQVGAQLLISILYGTFERYPRELKGDLMSHFKRLSIVWPAR